MQTKLQSVGLERKKRITNIEQGTPNAEGKSRKKMNIRPGGTACPSGRRKR
jgi:hypothetical protein